MENKLIADFVQEAKSIKEWRQMARGRHHSTDKRLACTCSKCAGDLQEKAKEQVAIWDKYQLLLKNIGKFRCFLSKPPSALPQSTMICLHGDLENVRTEHEGTVTQDLWGRNSETETEGLKNAWCNKHSGDGDVVNAENVCDEISLITEFDEIRALLERMVNGQ